tara:strand:+ start:351 stop:761 length:411 start_codon:yes stop_codon:yes gene_type:complete
MAATVYNGTVVKDTGVQNITLYTNNTGKNVRIVFNYLEAGSGSVGATLEFYFGETNNPNWNTTPYDDTTWFRALGCGNITGKYLSQTLENSEGPFPLELMMKPNHSIFIKMDSNVNGSPGSTRAGLKYNFVAITED